MSYFSNSKKKRLILNTDSFYRQYSKNIVIDELKQLLT